MSGRLPFKYLAMAAICILLAIIATTLRGTNRYVSIDEAIGELTELGEYYGIRITVESIPVTRQLSSYRIKADGAANAALLQYAKVLVSEMTVYPRDFIAHSGLREIVLCSALRVEGQPLVAISDVEQGVVFLDVNGGQDLREQAATIHHELFHVVDYSDDGRFREDPDWERLNPSGFQYGVGGWHLQWDSSASVWDSMPGFLNKYGRSAVEEDKAEVFANLILNYGAVQARAENDTIIQRKVEFIRNLVFNVSATMNTEFWQTLPVRKEHPKLVSLILLVIGLFFVMWMFGRFLLTLQRRIA